jgi:hypothetical protein
VEKALIVADIDGPHRQMTKAYLLDTEKYIF